MREQVSDTISSQSPLLGSGADVLIGALVRNAGAAAIIFDHRDEWIWAENLPEGLSDPEALSFLEPERAGADGQATDLAEARRNVRKSGLGVQIECRMTGGRSFDVHIDPLSFGPGHVTSGALLMTLIETTTQRRKEQTLRTLLREVSHRSKNLLAIIQSIANQTGRHSENVDMFLERLRGRIQSLAMSQDLVTSSNWDGARLHELVAEQTRRYCDPASRAVLMKGLDPYLNPNAALHVGLALHELTVNSASFGALSHLSGTVHLSCDSAEKGGLEIVWDERIPGLPLNGIRREQRFGSIALEKVVPAAIAGSATLEFAENRLRYMLTMPPENYREPDSLSFRPARSARSISV